MASVIFRALNSHAEAEEHVLYPALLAAVGAESETLYDDQAELKTFIAQAKQSEGEGLIAWMAKIEAAVSDHVMMEEQEVFPAFVETQTP